MNKLICYDCRLKLCLEIELFFKINHVLLGGVGWMQLCVSRKHLKPSVIGILILSGKDVGGFKQSSASPYSNKHRKFGE